MKTFKNLIRMSQFQLSDLDGKSIGYSNNSSMYNQLQKFLNELEEKEQDLYDQHNRLVADFKRTKSTIFQLTNKTETIGEKSKHLSKSVTFHTTSENDGIELKIAEIARLNNEIDIKIMNTDIKALEHESNIIQIRAEKLSTKKNISDLHNQKVECQSEFQEELNQFKASMNNCIKLGKSMNELVSFFKNKQTDYQKSIKEIKLDSHMLTQHLQNTEIQKCNIINKIKDLKSQLYKIGEYYEKKKRRNEFKQIEMTQQYKQDVNQIKNLIKLIQNTKSELQIQKNEIENALYNENTLKSKLSMLNNKILNEQKYSVQIDTDNQECKRQEQEQRRLQRQGEFQDHQKLYNYLNYLNNQIEIVKNQGWNDSHPKQDFLQDLSNDEDNEKVQEYFEQKDAIEKKENELAQLKTDIYCLKQDIESVRKSILESSITYSEIEEKAAKLLKSSVNRRKAIILQQEQRLIDHEDFITQTLVRIHNIRAKIVLYKSKIASATASNQLTSNMLHHVLSCCSTKLYKNEYTFLPDHYVFLSQ